MKKEVLLSAIMLVVTLTTSADEYTDPQTQVVYTYEPGQKTASVKAGYTETVYRGENLESETFIYPGSPNAANDVVILDKFTVGTSFFISFFFSYQFFYEYVQRQSLYCYRLS